MEKPKSRYPSESRFRDFRDGSLHPKEESAPSGGGGRPLDSRQATPRVSFSLNPSFRIPKKEGARVRSQEEGRHRSTGWGSRWDDRAPHERGERKHSSSRRFPRDGSRYSMDESDTASEAELKERDLGTEPARPSSLSRGSDRWSRKRPVFHHRTVSNFAESKRRRVAESINEEDGGSHMSVRARLAQDSDKMWQLGTRQPTEVAGVLSPSKGSPPLCAQKSAPEAVSSPEPPPPGVSLSPDAAPKKKDRPRKDSVRSRSGKAASKQQERQKEEAQAVVVVSDYSSDEWPVAPSPDPARSLPIPMSCSESEGEPPSCLTPKTVTNPTREGEDNSDSAVKPPSAPDTIEQVSLQECAIENRCHHKDFAGKRCCNPAVEGKRLCKCHYGDTLKLQEALGLLIASSAVQGSAQNATQVSKVDLETEPVSPVPCVSAVKEPMSPVTEILPPTKEEPSPAKTDPPQQSSVTEFLPPTKKEPPSPAITDPPQQSSVSLQQVETESPVCPTHAESVQHTTEGLTKEPRGMVLIEQQSVVESGSADQMNSSFFELDPSAVVTRVAPELFREEDKTGVPSPQKGVPQLDQLNAKEQTLMAHLVVLRKKKVAKEKELAVLLQQVEEIKQEIQVASAEWTKVNEAKRLLVLGETITVQEKCSTEQQLQQDSSETQDAHTTGSPVPTGLTTPPTQPLQQPVAVVQPTLTTAHQTTAQPTWMLFHPPHTDSVLDIKLATNVLITTSRDRTTHLYDITSGCFVASYEHHSKAVTCLDISAGIFATGSNDGRVVVYSVERCPQPLCMLMASSKVMCLKIVGKMIVVGLDNGKVEIFKATHPHPLVGVRCYLQNKTITAIEASRQYLVVGTTDETSPIMYWRLQDFLPASGQPHYSNRQCLSGMGGNIMSLQLRGESTLFSSTSQGHVLIHNLATGSLVHWFQAGSCAIPCVHVTDRGHLFVSTVDNTIACFSLKDYRIQGALQMPHPVYRLTVRHNHLYYGDHQGNVGTLCIDRITP